MSEVSANKDMEWQQASNVSMPTDAHGLTANDLDRYTQLILASDATIDPRILDALVDVVTSKDVGIWEADPYFDYDEIRRLIASNPATGVSTLTKLAQNYDDSKSYGFRNSILGEVALNPKAELSTLLTIASKANLTAFTASNLVNNIRFPELNAMMLADAFIGEYAFKDRVGASLTAPLSVIERIAKTGFEKALNNPRLRNSGTSE